AGSAPGGGRVGCRGVGARGRAAAPGGRVGPGAAVARPEQLGGPPRVRGRRRARRRRRRPGGRGRAGADPARLLWRRAGPARDAHEGGSVMITDLGTVLGVWAHPDDEAYLSGGLMALATDAGSRVVCATATRGELGTPDPDGWPPQRLAAERTVELARCLEVLRVTAHHRPGYRD